MKCVYLACVCKYICVSLCPSLLCSPPVESRNKSAVKTRQRWIEVSSALECGKWMWTVISLHIKVILTTTTPSWVHYSALQICLSHSSSHFHACSASAQSKHACARSIACMGTSMGICARLDKLHRFTVIANLTTVCLPRLILLQPIHRTSKLARGNLVASADWRRVPSNRKLSIVEPERPRR